MPLAKAYDPKAYESDIYKRWEDSGAFKPSGEGEPFCIIMPPPNANGELHVGHAVGYSVTDVITRYQRMLGKKMLWLPGTDHAGIETQFVYERDVLGPKGKSRLDFTPEQFYKDVMEFTLKQQGNIINQFKSMGFSADWSKLKFTLDEDIIDIVYDTFIQMHKDGLVYRGNRLVNWCTRCQAAFADIEVDRQQRQDAMYTLDYGPVQIATVRPETIFADAAVAVNPKDGKYKKLVGQEAVIPLIDRKVPIIADTHVDPKAGTGALKITPGHDPIDYEIGQEHKLPEISVIDFDGKLINVPDEFAGLSVEEGRAKVLEALKASNKLVKEEPLTHAVGIHDRCGTVIEPLISEQWFLRVKKLNLPVIRSLQNGDVKIFPARFTKIALNWLANEHDWCISRDSCWWGIRMPIYYKTSHDKDKEAYLIVKTEAEAKAYYGDGNYRAETATFDTWFSSGQWPYATLMTTGDYDAFYPTSLMGTAREILHKWVTRMIMFSLYKTARVPYHHVYLWGLVTDEKGQKMSKSKGNVLDPLAMTAKYGTDAVRLAGAISNTPGNDSPLGENKFGAYRNFNNKLWNVARFTIDKAGDAKAEAKAKSLADQWMLDRLNKGIATISSKLEQYRINEAANAVYHLLWDDLADWYVEASKPAANPGLLLHALETVLKLAHPFVPFVTEAIWQQLPNRQSMLIVTRWPAATKVDAKAAAQFSQLQQLVTELRTLKAEMELGPVSLYFKDSQLISANAELVKRLAGLSSVDEVTEGRGLPLVSTNNAWLGVDKATVTRYRGQLEAKQKETQDYMQKLEAQLNNQDFAKSAPKEVVEAAKHRHDEATQKAQTIAAQLKNLQ